MSDVLATLVALGVALWTRQAATAGGLPFPAYAYALPGALLAAAWVSLFAYMGLYSEWSTRSRMGEFATMAKAVVLGSIVLFVATFEPTQPFPSTRVVLGSYGATLLVVGIAGRALVRYGQGMLFARGRGGRNALIVGTGPRARQLGRAMSRSPRWGFRLVGYLAGEAAASDASGAYGGSDVRVLGSLDDLRAAIETHGAAEVIFADAALSHETVLNAISGCDGLRATFSIVPDLYDVVIGRSAPGPIYDVPLISLFPTAMPVWQHRTKRVVDVLISLLGIVVFLPLWLLVALAIWLEDRGPVFYSQDRLGHGGNAFRLHKFRSMIPEAEKRSGPVWAAADDPRITRVGRIIRLLRIDEVPQLWNVLRGEMSFVGPRPERPYFVERLAAEIPLYRRRLHVKPGVTGWAQTKQAYDSSLDDVREKLRYDLYYIENMSLRFDLVIIARTVWVVLTGRGAR